MSNKIIVYEKPTCTKCREMAKLLNQGGFEFEKVNYYTTLFTETKLKGLLKKMGVSPKELLRKTETKYRELNLSKANHSDAELIKLMVLHPELIQRPIVESGDQAVLGRPTENVKRLLK